ncbi:hypothetical protein [Enterococcus faecalis]|uniref:hypothetical protein n=1 Tax=Enterococcus faecalis TaxID=1351 RepID=UPI003530E43F
MMVVVMSIDGKLPVPLKVLQDRVQSKEDKKSGLKLKSNEKKGTRSKMRLKILKFWISDFLTKNGILNKTQASCVIFI